MCKLKSIIFLFNFINNLCLFYFVKCNHINYDYDRISDEILRTLKNIPMLSYNQTCIKYCSGINEICNVLGICECKKYYQYNEDLRACVECPRFGEFCFNNCCGHSGLQCINNRCMCVNDIGSFNMCHVTVSKTGVFMTASQIALTAALVMAIAALIMVIYRLCTKPRYLSQRHDLESITIARSSNCNSGGSGTSNFLRESLNSMQIRILSRLRDRPPAYDDSTTTNTNTTRQQNLQENISTIPAITNIPEAPPPYEAEREMNTAPQPPPYSEIIISPSNLNTPAPREGQNINQQPTTNTEEIKSKDENKVEIKSKQNL